MYFITIGFFLVQLIFIHVSISNFFVSCHTRRSQSDSIPDSTFGRNHQWPHNALNKRLSPVAAEFVLAIPTRKSHSVIPDYGNADKESDGNLHLLRETSADAFEVWASARSYGNATKDASKSFKYGLLGKMMNGNKVFRLKRTSLIRPSALNQAAMAVST